MTDHHMLEEHTPGKNEREVDEHVRWKAENDN